MSHSKLISPDSSQLQRSHYRSNLDISNSFNSPSKIDIKLQNSRNFGMGGLSAKNESKLRKYIHTVKNMYNNQMDRIKGNAGLTKYGSSLKNNKVCRIFHIY